MGETIDAVFSAPLANILVVSGIIFLLVAVLGTVAGKINPGKMGRIAAGVIGSILLAAGLSMHLIVEKIRDSDKREKEESTIDETHLKVLEDARRKAADEALQQALEDARRKAADEARQQALEDARRKAADEAHRQALEDARQKAADEARQQALEDARRKAEEDKLSNLCDPIRIPAGATCRNFYAERLNWDSEKISKCGYYQVRLYRRALDIRSQSEWERFLRPCKPL